MAGWPRGNNTNRTVEDPGSWSQDPRTVTPEGQVSQAWRTVWIVMLYTLLTPSWGAREPPPGPQLLDFPGSSLCLWLMSTCVIKASNPPVGLLDSQETPPHQLLPWICSVCSRRHVDTWDAACNIMTGKHQTSIGGSHRSEPAFLCLKSSKGRPNYSHLFVSTVFMVTSLLWFSTYLAFSSISLTNPF